MPAEKSSYYSRCARARVLDPKGLLVLEINGRTGYNVRLRADDYFARIKFEYFSTRDPLNVNGKV